MDLRQFQCAARGGASLTKYLQLSNSEDAAERLLESLRKRLHELEGPVEEMAVAAANYNTQIVETTARMDDLKSQMEKELADLLKEDAIMVSSTQEAQMVDHLRNSRNLDAAFFSANVEVYNTLLDYGVPSAMLALPAGPAAGGVGHAYVRGGYAGRRGRGNLGRGRGAGNLGRGRGFAVGAGLGRGRGGARGGGIAGRGGARGGGVAGRGGARGGGVAGRGAAAVGGRGGRGRGRGLGAI